MPQVVDGKTVNRIRRSSQGQQPLTIEQCRSIAAQCWFRNQVGGGEQREAFDRVAFSLDRPLSIELRADLWPRMFRERRALGDNPMTLTTSSGGYLVAEGFHDAFESALLSAFPVLALADVAVTDKGGDYIIGTVDDSSNSGAIKTINTARGEAQVMTCGQAVLKAYYCESETLLIPFELFEDAQRFMQTVPTILGQRVGRLIATKATTGAGSTEPQGILAGATVGVTAASQTAVLPDELAELVNSVDPVYREEIAVPRWVMHDNILLALRKLKDGNGSWTYPSLQERQPHLYGYGIAINNAMPSAFTAGSTPIAFGSMRAIKVRVVGDVAVTRLNVTEEMRAEYDQLAFAAYLRFDSVVSDPASKALKLLQMAAA